jgi:hypothetical protein
MGAVSIISYRILVEVNKHVCRTVLYFANWNIMDNTVYITKLSYNSIKLLWNIIYLQQCDQTIARNSVLQCKTIRTM